MVNCQSFHSVVLVAVVGAFIYMTSYFIYQEYGKQEGFQHRLSQESPRIVMSSFQPVSTADRHDKWVVLTTVAPPTDDVILLSRLPGWRVVVVGDTKTPSNWSYPNCVYLDIKKQESLGLKIATRLPYRSYTRKNMGYLYAIAHGAKVIYETDDDNRPIDQLSSFYLNDTCSGLMFAGAPGLFNPYKHFGQGTLWPRGYPLGSVGRQQESSYRVASRWDTPLIQQGVVNGDPDMDAIFRLTRKKTLSPLTVTFDPAAPPVILPEGVFSPFNTQNTLFHYRAFALLLLPTTTTFRMCDIWRGYWAQRLLWEIGGHLGFFPPNAYQYRNAHSYMADAKDEKEMYFDTDRLLDFLRHWRCPTELRFFDCVLKLSSDMALNHFWAEGDTVVTKLWLQDLRTVGYIEPDRVVIDCHKEVSCLNPVKNNSLFNSTYDMTILQSRWKNSTSKGTFVNFVPVEQTPPSVVSKPDTQSRYSPHIHKVASLCSDVTNMSISFSVINKNAHRSNHFSDTLLIIVFNVIKWLPSNIKYINVMHQHEFKNIVFCGSNCSVDCFRNISRQLPSQVSFIEVPTVQNKRPGWYGHRCLSRAVHMSYNVSGYLVIGDDVLLNTWNIRKLNKNMIWHSNDFTSFSCNKGTSWFWWPWERRRTRDAMAELHTRAQNSSLPGHRSALKFLTLMKHNTNSSGTCFRGLVDIYYIPQRFSEDIAHTIDFFDDPPIFMELVIPTAIYGTADKKYITLLNGTDLQRNKRKRMWEFYDPGMDYIHPIKLSTLTSPTEGRFMMSPSLETFCQRHLMNLLTL